MEVSASDNTKDEIPVNVSKDVKEIAEKVDEPTADMKTPLTKTAVSKVLTPKNQSGSKGTPASVR